MVRHAAREYGVQRARRDPVAAAGGVGARRRSTARGSATSPRCGTSTTATSWSPGFDAVSSIGLTEHIGVRNYPAYFALPARPAAPRGPAAQPLHHPARQPADRRPGAFIDRYVFPDGELIGSGPDHHRGAERRPRGAARGEHPRALRADPGRLVPQPRRRTGTTCVAEVGEGTARVWGLYMAGSRLAFERNEIQLHHVLATKTDRRGQRLPAAPTGESRWLRRERPDVGA